MPLPGVPFDERRATVPNDRGRVEGADRTYVAGWIKRGPSGVIGTNKKDATETVEQLLDEASSPKRLRRVIAGRLRRGIAVPGFGHPLYPDGDPRGRLLCDLVADARSAPAISAWVDALRETGADLLGEHPTIDVGLVILRRALRLPRGAAFLLFATGRSAGWIAHAIEQAASGQIIRPRASYAE